MALIMSVQAEQDLDALTQHIKEINRIIRRMYRYEKIEEAILNGGHDKFAGRNRLSLRYGRE